MREVFRIDKFFLYSSGIVSVSLASAAIPLMLNWSRCVIRLFISYGAGVILSVAFVHMLPEAIEAAEHSVGFFLLVGFSGMYIMEKFIMMHPCDEHECDFHSIGLTAFVGFSIHSFIAGLSLGSSMGTELLGGVVFMAIIIHKMPESFSLASLLYAGNNYTKKQILLFMLLFSLVVPLGMICAIKFLVVNNQTTGIMIAIAAGTFIEIAACDILPELHRDSEWRKRNLLAFIVGLLSISILGFLE